MERVTGRLSEVEHAEVNKSQTQPDTQPVCFCERKVCCFLQRNSEPALHFNIISSTMQLKTSKHNVHRKWAGQDEKKTTASKLSHPQSGLPSTRKWWLCPHTVRLGGSEESEDPIAEGKRAFYL